MKKRILSLLLCLCMVLLMAPAAMATKPGAGDTTTGTITVSPVPSGDGNSGSYTDLATAIAAVNAMSGVENVTISLSAGTFTVTENNKLEIKRDNVVLQGAGVDQTIIDYGATSCQGQGGLIVSANSVIVQGMTITSSTSPDGNVSAVKVTDVISTTEKWHNLKDVTLKNLKLYSPVGHALNLHGIEGAIVDNVTATSGQNTNAPATGKCGISLASAKDVTITNTTASGKWGSIGMMYTAGDPAYNTPVSVELSEGNDIGLVYSERSVTEGGTSDTVTVTAPQGDNFIVVSTATGKKTPALEVKVEGDAPAPTNMEAKIGDTCYPTLQDAIDAAGTNDVGTTIELLKEVTVSASGKQDTQGALTINKNLTINGNGHTISGTGFTATGDVGGASLINIGTNTVNVTLNNVKLNGGATNTSTAGAKHGLNINSTGGTVTLNNVEIMNCRWYAVMNNGANLIVDGLKTHDNKWGINIDKGGSINIGGNTTIGEDASIVFENSKQDVVPSKNNQITGGSYQHIEIKGTNNATGLTISGGKFSTAAGAPGTNYIDVEDYLAPGLELKADGSVGKPYTPPANPSYSITTPAAENGKVTVSPTSAKAGAKVTITVTPDDGFELDELTVTRGSTAVTVTKNSDGTYSFTMPQGSVTVTATFVCDGGDKCPSAPFTDVNTSLWYHEEIDYVVENGLMNGDSPTTFAPQRELSRAELAQILYNKEGRPAVEGDMVFADVPAGEWFYPAILWANQEEVVGGDSPTTFVPNRAITREELAVMLYRYAGKPAASGSLKDFTDGDEVSTWAEDAMVWAVTEGIISGDTPTTLDPGDGATRAEAAAMLMRFCENVEQ